MATAGEVFQSQSHLKMPSTKVSTSNILDTSRAERQTYRIEQSSASNLKGAKSMPDLSPPLKTQKSVSEPETPRGAYQYGKPAIAFGSRVTAKETIERSSPNIRQDILSSSRFGHSGLGSGKNKGLSSREGSADGTTGEYRRQSFTKKLDNDIDRDDPFFDE